MRDHSGPGWGGQQSLCDLVKGAEARLRRYRIVAFDMRGHGETSSNDDLDLSSNTLSAVGSPDLSGSDWVLQQCVPKMLSMCH